MHSNTLLEIEGRYTSGELTKPDYIEQMYRLHQTLFDYGELLGRCNADRITISREHVTVTTRDGVTLICNPGDWRIMPIEILNFGDYEAAETRLLKSLVEPDSVVVDIGANIGWYAIQLGRAVPRGRVLAFEPIPETLACLRRNLALNDVRNVEIFEHGLAEAANELVFYFHPRISGATSARDLITDQESFEVRASVKRLDDTLRGEERIDLLKCDVEGAEIFVLQGGLETIGRTRPAMFIEMLRKWCAKYGYHPNDIIDLVAPLGYRCFAIGKDARPKPVERVDESTIPTNFLYLHQDRHAGRIAEYTR